MKKISKLTRPEDGSLRAALFLEKPDRKIYPDYYVLVPRPTSFKDITTKLKKGLYTSIEDVETEFALMAHNARMYNLDTSPVFAECESLREEFHLKTAKIREQFDLPPPPPFVVDVTSVIPAPELLDEYGINIAIFTPPGVRPPLPERTRGYIIYNTNGSRPSYSSSNGNSNLNGGSNVNSLMKSQLSSHGAAANNYKNNDNNNYNSNHNDNFINNNSNSNNNNNKNNNKNNGNGDRDRDINSNNYTDNNKLRNSNSSSNLFQHASSSSSSSLFLSSSLDINSSLPTSHSSNNLMSSLNSSNDFQSTPIIDQAIKKKPGSKIKRNSSDKNDSLDLYSPDRKKIRKDVDNGNPRGSGTTGGKEEKLYLSLFIPKKKSGNNSESVDGSSVTSKGERFQSQSQSQSQYTDAKTLNGGVDSVKAGARGSKVKLKGMGRWPV